jgi:hypothetical protein
MGLLELYNQITNGILPSGDNKKHIDNMPLGNPQWENKNDTTTDYGNTDQITGTPTPNQYPAGPIESYTQIYDKDNTYLDQIYTNTNNDAESPLSESLNSSQLDNQNNPNPDPTEYPVEANSLVAQNSGNKNYSQDNGRNNKYNTTISDSPLLDSLSTSSLDDMDNYNPSLGDPTKYPIEAQAQGTGAQPYEQKYYNETGKEYDDKVNRNDITDSPLTDRLGDSNEYSPDELTGPFNFTPSYDLNNEYDSNVGFLEDGNIVSNISNSFVFPTPESDPTIYPIEAQAHGTAAQSYEQEYTSGEKYDTTISDSPLLDSLDSSSLDDMDGYKSDEDDPTVYPIEANSLISSFTGDKNFQQKYYNKEDKEYSDKVNRDENENSPLNSSLIISQLDNEVNYNGPGTTTPDNIDGEFNFTPSYNEDENYEDNVGLIDGEYVSNISNSFEDTPTKFKDPTLYRADQIKKTSNVKGINPITGEAPEKFDQKYNSNFTYYNHLEKEKIETR